MVLFVKQMVLKMKLVVLIRENTHLKNEKELIKDFVSENGSITRKQTEELIGAGTTKAFRMLRELCESGKLTAVGKGKVSKYVLK